jgi:hypothetical protein
VSQRLYQEILIKTNQEQEDEFLTRFHHHDQSHAVGISRLQQQLVIFPCTINSSAAITSGAESIYYGPPPPPTANQPDDPIKSQDMTSSGSIAIPS